MNSNRILLCIFVISIVFFYQGCSSTSQPKIKSDVTQSHATQTPIRCTTEEDCPEDLICSSEGICAINYFRDDTDAGDDIWKAGCHWYFSDPDCTQNKRFLDGDQCAGKIMLLEWTKQECHPPEPDLKEYDCDAECRRKGATGGVCVYDKNVCDGRWLSARCECTGVTP